MRKILLPALAVLFTASSLSAQEQQVSPLIQETLEPSPTVVRTYEPFQVNYRLTFMDLSEYGKEIQVLEDRLNPSEVFSLCSQSQGTPLCAEEDFSVEKYETEDNYVWDITYTLRRIGPNKGQDTIPPIAFQWSLKDAGQSDSDAEVRTSESDPIVFRYATSLVKKPNLDIRDRTVVKEPKKKAYTAWVVLGIIFLLLAGLLAKELVWGRNVYQEASEVEELAESSSDNYYKRLSKGEARSQLRSAVNSALESGQVAEEKEVARAIKNFILAYVPEVQVGYTVSEIRDTLESIDHEKNREALVSLCEIMSSDDISDVEKLKSIDDLVNTFKWYKQAWYEITGSVSGIREWFSNLLEKLDHPGVDDEN